MEFLERLIPTFKSRKGWRGSSKGISQYHVPEANQAQASQTSNMAGDTCAVGTSTPSNLNNDLPYQSTAHKQSDAVVGDASTCSSQVSAGDQAMDAYPDCPERECAPMNGLPYNVRDFGPPRPPCEADRQATIELLDLIDAPPDEEIDNLLRLICEIFQSPAALVALFDDNRIFIRNAEGGFQRGDFPWRSSFCAWCLAPKEAELIVIPDALEDKRFCNNDFVRGPPGVRFYCGSPLMASNGHRLGTICFIDTKPRHFDTGSARLLNNFAELVVRQLEKDLALAAMHKQEVEMRHQREQQVYGHLLRALDANGTSGVILVDSFQPGWPILHANHQAAELTGLQVTMTQRPSIKAAFQLKTGTEVDWEQYDPLARGCNEFVVHKALCAGGGSHKVLDLHFRPAQREPLDPITIPVNLPTHLNMEAFRTGLYFVQLTVHEERTAAQACPDRRGRRPALGSSISYDQHIIANQLPGLELGMLLGRGAHGAVYYGRWFGSEVAVKVMHHLGSADGAALEALLSQQLHHPHVLHTCRWALITHDSDQSSLSSGFEGLMQSQSLCTSDPHCASPIDSSSQTLDGCSGPVQTLEGPLQHPKPLTACGASAAPTTNPKHPSSQALGAPAPQAQTLTGCHQQGGSLYSSSANDSRLLSSSCLDLPPSCNPFMSDALAAESDGSSMQVDSTSLPSQQSEPWPSGLLLAGAHSSAADAAMSDGYGSWFSKVSGSNGEVWMVMDFCDRGTLEDAIDRGRMHEPVPPGPLLPRPRLDHILVTALEVASAMMYLHERGIIHGDLTGANVLLTSSGADSSGRGYIAKVADFGLAHDLGLVQSRINTNCYGTVTHMPPELLNKGEMSRATDVYSFGVLLWSLYTGSRPWAGISHVQVIHLVCNLHRKLQLPSSCPPAYKVLVSRCMESDVSCRPSFKQIYAALEALINVHSRQMLMFDSSDSETSSFAAEMHALECSGIVQSL